MKSLKPRTKRVLLWIAGIWIALMLGFAPSMHRAWKEKQACEKSLGEFFVALIHRDYVRAYSLCGSEFHGVMSYDEFSKQQELLRSHFGELRSFKQGRSEVEGRHLGTGDEFWVAVIHCRLQYEKGEPEFVYELRPTDGHWAIYGYEQR